MDAATGEELWRHQTPVVGESTLRYGRVGDMLVLANEASEGDEPSERLTRLLDLDGELIGDIDTGIDRPSVLASDPAGDTFVIGDDHQLVGFRVTTD